MLEAMRSKWEEAERTGKPIYVGRLVVCDICAEDWTDSDVNGGFIFGSKAYCPNCAPGGLESIRRYGEEGYIRASCPHGTSFSDFVRASRGPEATVQVLHGEEAVFPPID